MAVINYSGSQKITGCTITTWTSATDYMLKLTEDCKLSISGTRAIRARAGDEFVIQTNEPYIFDRDTDVLLAYADPVATQEPPIYEASMSSQNDINSSTGFTTVLAIPTFDALSDYDVYACVPYWSVGEKTITVKIMDGTTTLATVDKVCPTSQYTLITINSSLTTAISANSVIELQVENGGTSDSIVGNRTPCILQFRDNA